MNLSQALRKYRPSGRLVQLAPRMPVVCMTEADRLHDFYADENRIAEAIDRAVGELER